MLGFNGGLIGATRNTTSQASVSGIWTPREQLRARRESLWPVAAAAYVDPYASFVSLYLKGDGPNASTTFIDSSPAPKTVTAVGNAQISTAQSKFGGASILFDGSGDYLSIPNTEASDIYNADFTIEAWIYLTTSSQFGTIYATGWPIALYINGTTPELYCKDNVNGADPNLFSGGKLGGQSIGLNAWTHIAVTRQGSTYRIFQNGTQTATATPSGSTARSTASYFGVGNNSVFTSFFNGYIDDLRITKGVARYTANFTPTYDADPYASSTVLLLKGDGVNGSTTFVDSSSSTLSPTVVGSVTTSTAQSKFGGSSIYINGPGSRLSYAASSLHVFGSSDFTIEGWLYIVGGQIYARMLHYGPAWNNSNAWGINAKDADFPGKIAFASFKLGGRLCVSTTTIATNTWYHVAVTRSSGVFRLFINGIAEATNNSHVGVTIESATTNELGIGSSAIPGGVEDLTGYIDDLRITKGVARYTANFTPPGAL